MKRWGIRTKGRIQSAGGNDPPHSFAQAEKKSASLGKRVRISHREWGQFFSQQRGKKREGGRRVEAKTSYRRGENNRKEKKELRFFLAGKGTSSTKGGCKQEGDDDDSHRFRKSYYLGTVRCPDPESDPSFSSQQESRRESQGGFAVFFRTKKGALLLHQDRRGDRHKGAEGASCVLAA